MVVRMSFERGRKLKSGSLKRKVHKGEQTKQWNEAWPGIHRRPLKNSLPIFANASRITQAKSLGEVVVNWRNH